MEPAAILDEFVRSEDLPREALRAAAERRADMVPLFVAEIENYAAGGGRRVGNTPLFFIFHLLGEWREASAYRALARLLRCPPDDVDAAIATPSPKPRIASWPRSSTATRTRSTTSSSTRTPISSCARACARRWPCWCCRARLDRAEAASFLGDCWINLQPRDDCFVWHGWQSAIALLGLAELKDIVKEAFDREIIDPGWLGYQDSSTISHSRS